MKFSTFVVIALLGVMAGVMVNDSMKKNAAIKEEEALHQSKIDTLLKQSELLTRQALATPDPALQSAPPTVTQSQLLIARGIVIGATPGGLLVNCFEPTPGEGVSLPANAGDAEIDRAAQNAIDEEQRTWGYVMIAQGGGVRPAGWAPVQFVAGEIVLRNYPGEAGVANGDRLKIIAAPLPEVYSRMHVLSAQFTLTDREASPTSNAWMWRRGNNPLNQPAHP